jgi:hypothetical protein
MLGTFLKGAGSSEKLNYLNTYAVASSQTTFTFNDVDFGRPAPDRTIIVVQLARTATARSFSSCLIGGSTPNRVGNSSSNVPASIFSINLASGTSGAVSVTFNGSVSSGCSIAVYAAYGFSSAVAVSSGFDGVTSATSRSVTLTSNANDIVFAGLLLADNQNPTWSNATQDSSVGIADSRQTYYASNKYSPSGSVTISASWPNSVTNGLIAANFR